MKAKFINTKGVIEGDVDLPSVFTSKISHELIGRSISIYLANQRTSTANTKGRGEVSGSTRKLYKQKGTGNARRGSIRSPLMRGGGIVFGPTSGKNYKRSLSKIQRLNSMRAALSLRADEGKVFVYELPEMGSDKLSLKAQKFIKSLELGKKTLIVQDNFDKAVVKAFNSLENVSVKALSELSVYDIINNGTILFDKSTVENIDKRFSLK